jgi:hypothetical protein
MADRDRAAVDVEPVHRDARLVGAVENLHRERLVEFPEVDVGDRRPRRFKHLRHGEHRADAHLVGLAAADREAEEAARAASGPRCSASFSFIDHDQRRRRR